MGEEGSISSKYLWPFSFEPYDIQKGLMESLYDCVEHGDVGIFESPTGTGKSLSIICSSLHWLRENRGREKKLDTSLNPPKPDEGSWKLREPSWIQEYWVEKEQEEKSLAEQRVEERRKRVEREREREKRTKKTFSRVEESKGKSTGRKRKLDRVKSEPGIGKEEEDEEDIFAPDSDPEEADDLRKRLTVYYSSDEEGNGRVEDEELDANEPEDKVRKVFFCSRTHSQLSQFVSEVRRTPFGKEIPCVALGSRKQLCVHPNLRQRRLPVNKMNDKCLELADKGRKQQGKKHKGVRTVTPASTDGIPSRSACPYYEYHDVQKLKDRILYEAQDIETVAEVGKQRSTCAYYASRAAVKEAELVALPYSMLLHKRTRESLGISLKGNIVICDEAHNVIEAINETHSGTIYLSQLEQTHAELLEYKARYLHRLKPANKVGINSLIKFVRGLLSFLKRCVRSLIDRQEAVQTLSTGELTIEAQIDHINLIELVRYLETSRLCQKLTGFAQKMNAENGGVAIQGGAIKKVATNNNSNNTMDNTNAMESSKKDDKPKTVKSSWTDGFIEEQIEVQRSSPVMVVKAFMEGLFNSDSDAKVMVAVNKDSKSAPNGTRMKLLMLNPGVYFKQVVDEARSVILAGGTMQPTQDVESQLFSNLAPGRKVKVFSFDHVVPRNNMLCMPLIQGPTKKSLELNFKNRSNPETIQEVGRCIAAICQVTPNGVVVFMPSYSYADQVFAEWEKSNIMERIATRKIVFKETKAMTDTDKMLSEYALHCKPRRGYKQTGAILFSVVGGKLSEGINFKDELARTVVMVGMPFANPNDPEMQAKFKYLDTNTKSFPGSTRKPSQEYYQNQCMKAVNQCIGRAIRHKEDFSAVVLIDTRYTKASTMRKLPKWILKSWRSPTNFSGVYRELFQFFQGEA